jgi:hypothetical protein
MLWDYLKTLIVLRLTLQSPCMCAGCQRGRRASQPLELLELQCHFAHEPRKREQSFRRRRYCLGELGAERAELFVGVFFLEEALAIERPLCRTRPRHCGEH